MSTAFAGPVFAQQSAPTASARPAPAMQFDIRPGPLDAALGTFIAITGDTLELRIPADTVAMLTSPGASGVLTFEAALARLLEGTSLRFQRSGTTIVIDVRGIEESVEVTGRISGLATPKLTEPLRDIPQTITVIPRAVMEEQGATTLRDVLRNVAGITFQAARAVYLRETSCRFAASARAPTCSWTAFETSAAIRATRSTSNKSK